MLLELPMLAQEPVEGGNPEGVKVLKEKTKVNTRPTLLRFDPTTT